MTANRKPNQITVETTFREILDNPIFQPFHPFLLSNCGIPDKNWSLKEMNDYFYDWEAEPIAMGLNRLQEVACSAEKAAFDIYTEKEKAEDPERNKTKLFFFPGEKEKPCMIICPGGGYGAVCSLKEGFPLAKRLNDLGYNAFVLSYRVRSFKEKSFSGILPGPIEDLAAAVRFIQKNETMLGVSLDRYAIAGFSSGGHLSGEWATENVGSVRYGLPRPSFLVLGYAASDPSLIGTFRGMDLLRESMFGKNYAPETIHWYNVNEHIDAAYPPTYLYHCVDDEIISVETSRRMDDELTKMKVPHQYHEFEKGGHGFGLGEQELNASWFDEMIAFGKKTMRLSDGN